MLPNFRTLATIALTSILAFPTSAHWYLQEIKVNNVSAGFHNALRIANTKGPLWRVNETSIICNDERLSANRYVAKWSPNKIEVRGGDSLSFYWEPGWGNSHQGPVSVYLAKVEDSVKETPREGWFKIYEDGFRNGKWATNDMGLNGGWVDNVNVPDCLAAGDYVLRTELIALHEADVFEFAQFYPSCAHITVVGNTFEFFWILAVVFR